MTLRVYPSDQKNKNSDNFHAYLTFSDTIECFFVFVFFFSSNAIRHSITITHRGNIQTMTLVSMMHGKKIRILGRLQG